MKGVTKPKKPYTRGGFETKEAALEHGRKKEQEFLEQLQGVPKIQSISFEKFAEKYLELCEQNNTLRYFRSKRSIIEVSLMPFFEKKRLVNIRPKDIEAYIAKRRSDKVIPGDPDSKNISPKTISNEYGVLSHMFNQAIRWDYLRVNPCDKVDKPKFAPPLPEYLSEEQIRQVFEYAEDHVEWYEWHYVVKILFYTGMRRGELLNVRWLEDVDLQENILAIQAHDMWQPKDYEARTIPINSVLHDTLVEFREWQYSEGMYQKYVLPRAIFGFEDYFTKKIGQLLKAAGVKVKQPVHVWRHSFAYHMVRGGAKIPYLQTLLGHEDIRTTMNYLKLTLDDVSEQTEILPDFSRTDVGRTQNQILRISRK